MSASQSELTPTILSYKHVLLAMHINMTEYQRNYPTKLHEEMTSGIYLFTYQMPVTYTLLFIEYNTIKSAHTKSFNLILNSNTNKNLDIIYGNKPKTDMNGCGNFNKIKIK